MNRFVAVPALGALLLVACEDPTGPNPVQPGGGGPLFEQSPPGPSDRECVISLPAGDYQNVIVPEGQTCTINSSRIFGNIKVLAGAALTATSNSVSGSIQADKAITVHVHGGRVDGGIGIFDGLGGPITLYDYSIQNVTVTRDIHLSKNRGSIIVYGNTLPTGNITVSENQIPLGTDMNIQANTIAGDIHVIKNNRLPLGSETGGNIIVLNNIIPLGNPLVATSGKGNIKVEDNFVASGNSIIVQNNSIPQNLQVFKNEGPGHKFVNLNSASESVQCFENALPFVGTPNTAPKKEGQCVP